MALSEAAINTYLSQINSGVQGAALAYYNYLAANDVPYGAIVAQVITNEGFAGVTVNTYLEYQARQEHPEWTDAEFTQVADKLRKDLAASFSRRSQTRVSGFFLVKTDKCRTGQRGPCLQWVYKNH